MQNLIIGESSKIVNAIKPKLANCVFISHRDVPNVDFSRFERIYLFSWRFAGGNLEFIKTLPLDKLIFVSTIAVQANYIASQRAIYPIEKLEAETLVLAAGGSVIRVGIWDAGQIDFLFGPVPLTTPDLLVSLINSGSIKSGDVVTPFELISGRVTGFRRFVFTKLQNYHIRHPDCSLTYFFLALLGRLFKVNNYGYTGDALLFFNKSIQIGFGAFGGFHYKNTAGSKRVLFSNSKFNRELLHAGFNGTLIGKTTKGLSSLWHGVFVKKNEKFYKKRIVRFGKSFSLPSGALAADVDTISFDSKFFVLNIASNHGCNVQFFCEQLYIAAGSLENARLLKSLDNITASFDDHELAFVGKVSTLDVINAGCLRRFLCFVFYQNSMVVNFDNLKFLVDVRPAIKSPQGTDVGFYSASFFVILKRIFSSKNLSRYNEALFCRFGFAFTARQSSVFVQLLQQNCITFDANHRLSRVRASRAVWEAVSNAIKKSLPSFEYSTVVNSIDAQHVWGGSELLASNSINALITAKRLIIIGSPSHHRLDALHHTVDFRKRITFS